MRFQSEEKHFQSTPPPPPLPDESADRPTSSSLFTILENNFLRFVTHPQKNRATEQPPNDGLRREVVAVAKAALPQSPSGHTAKAQANNRDTVVVPCRKAIFRISI